MLKLAIEDVDSADFVARLGELCVSLAPGWDTTSVSDLLPPVACEGGVTNKIYIVKRHERVSGDDGAVNAVVVRLFGAGSDLIIDRNKELRMMERLASQGLGPTVYAVFESGRLEEFIDGRGITLDEMQSLWEPLSRQLAALHSVPLLPGEDTSMFDQMNGFAKQACAWKPIAEDVAAKLRALDLPTLAAEIEPLKILSLSSFASPVVVCHMDLLCGNVLLLNDGTIMFIDFEYGAVNPRSYDIANHFLEYVGFEPTMARYPSLELRKRFVENYLKCRGEPHSQAEVEEELRRIEFYSLHSHLYWGFWALNCAETSTIDFDYIAYATGRFERFADAKAALKL